MNYDRTRVGVPYIRYSQIVIRNPANHGPWVDLTREWAVKLEDGTSAAVDLPQPPPVSLEINLATQAGDAFPMYHPDTGLPIGQSTNFENVLLAIIAAARQVDAIAEAAAQT